MGWISNANSQVLLDFETAFGTPPITPAAIKLPFLTCDLKVDQKPNQSKILGAGRRAGKPYYGLKTITGNLTGPIDLIAIGYILKMVFGAPESSEGGSPYTHVFSISDSTPSFLLEKGWPTDNKYYLYSGCKATGLSINFGGNGQLIFTVPIIGASEEYSSSSYDDEPLDATGPSTVFGNADASVSEGEAPSSSIEELNLSFKNNSAMGYGLAGTGGGTMAREGNPTVEGSFKGLFDGDTLLAYGRAHTGRVLSVACVASAYSLTVAMSKVRYSQESPAITGPEGAYLNLSFVGSNEAASEQGSEFLVTLINSQDSYADPA